MGDKTVNKPLPQPEDQHYEGVPQGVTTTSNLCSLIHKLKRNNRKLKKSIKEYAILDRYVKGENELLKTQSFELRMKIEQLQKCNRKILRSTKTMKKLASKHIIHNRIF